MEYKIHTNRNVGDVVYVIEGYYTLKGIIKGVESKATCNDGNDPIVETKYMVEMEDFRCTYSQKSIFHKDEKELYSSLNEVAVDILNKHGIRAVELPGTANANAFRVIRLKSDEIQRLECED